MSPDVGEVLLVVLRYEDRLHAGAMRREQLLLEAADRHHTPAERDLARPLQARLPALEADDVVDGRVDSNLSC